MSPAAPGVRLPVFLGSVDLRDVGRTYYYDIEVCLAHFMLLSWGGSSLDETEAQT